MIFALLGDNNCGTIFAVYFLWALICPKKMLVPHYVKRVLDKKGEKLVLLAVYFLEKCSLVSISLQTVGEPFKEFVRCTEI